MQDKTDILIELVKKLGEQQALAKPDYTLVFTILGGVIALVGTVIVLFLWNRAEARNDSRNMQDKIDADSRHTDSKIESIRELVRSIHDEVRDFHNRLYKLEQKNLKEK